MKRLEWQIFGRFVGAFEGELGYFAIAQYASPCAAYFWQRRADRSSLPGNTAAWPVLLAHSCANTPWLLKLGIGCERCDEDGFTAFVLIKFATFRDSCFERDLQHIWAAVEFTVISALTNIK